MAWALIKTPYPTLLAFSGLGKMLAYVYTEVRSVLALNYPHTTMKA